MFISSSEPNGLGAADKLCGLRARRHIFFLFFIRNELDEALDYQPVSNPWITARAINQHKLSYVGMLYGLSCIS
jgi:hypothetical protein